MIFETHAHYDDRAFDDDREEVIESLKQENIDRVVNVGADMASSKISVELSERYDNFYATVGVHPSEVEGLVEEDMETLEKLIITDREKIKDGQRKKIVAIGEIGLDYHWDEPGRELQIKWFKEQLKLAAKLNMPVVIHSRDAAEDTYNILEEYVKGESVFSTNTSGGEGNKIYGIIHCYSYTPEMAKRFINLGFVIGIGGVLTFKNAKKIKETAKELPLDKIVIETDCPYMAPEPNRGKRNDSRNLKYVVEALAEFKETDVETIEKVTYENACKVYDVPQV